LRGSTILLQDHDMYIYDSHERQITHAIQFLKEGLKNNESCILIANYHEKTKIRTKERRKSQSDTPSYIKTLGMTDIKVVSASNWFLTGQSAKRVSLEKVISSWAKLSSKAALRGRTRLRAFVDMSLLFRHQLLEDLIELESRVSSMQNLPIKLICAYLESDLSLLLDLSLLSLESYKKICQDHGHVHHVTS
jgi:hypothetical protein